VTGPFQQELRSGASMEAYLVGVKAFPVGPADSLADIAPLPARITHWRDVW